MGAVLRGALGFAGVSLGGFGVWAFGGKWFYRHVGEAGLYAVSALVFVGVSGLLLNRLVTGPSRLWRFYTTFIPAFLAYSGAWCAAWFMWHFGWGEWIGSLLGTLIFSVLTARGLGSYAGFGRVWLVVFASHSAGYFLGGQSMSWVGGPGGAAILTGVSAAQIGVLSKLSWGLWYGLGFGAGIGYAFFTFQRGGEVRRRT